MAAIRQSLPPMPGEDPATTSPEDVNLWANVYDELVRFSLSARDRGVHERYRARLEYWRARQRNIRAISPSEQGASSAGCTPAHWG